MKALITAGRSNSLRPFTDTKNKHLIELANKPMLFYALEKIIEAGIHEIGIIVEEGDGQIERAVNGGAPWNATLTFIPQKGGGRGIAHAMHCARDFLGDESFMLYLGDNIIDEDLRPILKTFEEKNLNCLLTIARVPKPERFGVPEFDSTGKIIRVEERPIEPKSPYAIAGLYVYDKNAHTAYSYIKPSFRGDYEISDINSWLAENGYKVHHHEIKKWWKDRGSAQDLLDANQMILGSMEGGDNGSFDTSTRFEGPVRIGEGTRIGGRTTIRGPVIIGEYCLIKDSYIGPYTSVGNKVELHGADVENSILFEGTSITTSQKITDSIIGENSLITSAEHHTPRGGRFVVGQNSSFSI